MYTGRTKRYDEEVLDRICNFLGVRLCELLEYVPDEQAGAQQRPDKAGSRA